ncbi:MAG: hypothetical protein GX661_02070 [Acholeplasmataceae bacterium]|nr:hypothetical protein [Acholeplasmataceae bacterium]
MKKESPTNHYELKTEAIDELAAALKEDPTKETKTEVKIPKPYQNDKLAKIPTWIKVLFVKFWIAGAICYFGYWGLGLSVPSTFDLLVLVGLITGVVNYLLVNPAFLHFETDKKEYHAYLLLPIPSKKYWTIIVHIVYGMLVNFAVFGIYTLINLAFVAIKDLPEGTITLGVEPLLYGLFFMMVDMFFVSIKNLIVKAVLKTKWRL